MLLAVARLARAPESSCESFNISSGQALSMKELASQVIHLVGSGSQRPGPPSNQSFSLYAAIDRAVEDLGFTPRVGIESMIGRLIHHFKERQHHGQPANDHRDHYHQCASIA
jgi:nucleoside-diphosphate-sugar epimerase